MSLESMQEVARLNEVGVSFLAKGNGSNALKAFKGALAIMAQVAQGPTADEFFENKEQACTTQVIPGLESPFYLYGKAFLFEASEHMDIAFSNALILFNLALAFHQRGIACGQESKLKKAVSLYGLSNQLIGNLTPYSGAMLLAALNNMAQIQFDLCDYESASETLCLLEEELTLVPLSQAVLEPEQLDQFILNLELTRAPFTAASA